VISVFLGMRFCCVSLALHNVLPSVLMYFNELNPYWLTGVVGVCECGWVGGWVCCLSVCELVSLSALSLSAGVSTDSLLSRQARYARRVLTIFGFPSLAIHTRASLLECVHASHDSDMDSFRRHA
jgi:hypothetical protein